MIKGIQTQFWHPNLIQTVREKEKVKEKEIIKGFKELKIAL